MYTLYMFIMFVLLTSLANANEAIKAQARSIASEEGIDPTLFVAIIAQESQFKINAYNARTGDWGLGQINEYNVRAMGLDRARLLTDSEYNLRHSAKILKYFKKRYAHEHRYWVRYNCGTGKLERQSCLRYAFKVLKNYKQVKKEN